MFQTFRFFLILSVSPALAAASVELLVMEMPAETATRVIAACNDRSMKSSVLDTGITKILSTNGVATIFAERKDAGKHILFQDFKPGPKPPPTDEPDLVPRNLGLECECAVEETKLADVMLFRMNLTIRSPSSEKYSHISRNVNTVTTLGKGRWAVVGGWGSVDETTLVLTKYVTEGDDGGGGPTGFPSGNSTVRIEVVSTTEMAIEAFDRAKPEDRQKAAKRFRGPKCLQSVVLTSAPGYVSQIDIITQSAVRNRDFWELTFKGLRSKMEGLPTSDNRSPENVFKLVADWTSTVTNERARDYEFVGEGAFKGSAPLLFKPTTVNRPSEGALVLLISEL